MVDFFAKRHRPQWCVYMVKLWPSAIFCHPPLITLDPKKQMTEPNPLDCELYIVSYLYYVSRPVWHSVLNHKIS